MAFFGIVGLVIFIISAVFFAPVMTDYVKTGMVNKFPTLIVCGVCVSISVVLWGVGLILDCIVKKDKQAFMVKANLFTRNKED
jgi:hypothetical protein